MLNHDISTYYAEFDRLMDVEVETFNDYLSRISQTNTFGRHSPSHAAVASHGFPQDSPLDHSSGVMEGIQEPTHIEAATLLPADSVALERNPQARSVVGKRKRASLPDGMDEPKSMKKKTSTNDGDETNWNFTEDDIQDFSRGSAHTPTRAPETTTTSTRNHAAEPRAPRQAKSLITSDTVLLEDSDPIEMTTVLPPAVLPPRRSPRKKLQTRSLDKQDGVKKRTAPVLTEATKSSSPPQSPIEDFSLVTPGPEQRGVKNPVAERDAAPAPVQSHNSVLLQQIMASIAKHPASKRRGTDAGLKVRPLAGQHDESSVIDVNSSSPAPDAGASSSKPNPATVKKAAPIRPTLKPAPPQTKKTKKLLLPAPEYAKKLITEYATKPPEKNQCLKGNTIFYWAPEHNYASATTINCMRVILRRGGTLAPKYDRSTVTHIIVPKETQAHQLATHLGLKKITDLPEHVPTLVWSWVAEGFGKQEYWCHAAFSERMEVGIAVRKPTRPKRVTSSTKSRDEQLRAAIESDHGSDTEEDEVPEPPPQASSSKMRLDCGRPPTKIAMNEKNDPLAPFYAQARAEAGRKLSRKGEAEDETDSGSDTDTAAKVDTLPRKKGFTCDNKNASTSSPCVNQDIIDKLAELVEIHRAKGTKDDQWRILSYSKCMRGLRNYPTRINNYEDAMRLPYCGEKTAQKIVEILNTGALRRIHYENTADLQAMKLFKGIYGVGSSIARVWATRGCRSLEDLTSGKGGVKLSAAQMIGIQYYDDINSRMPRDEARRIFELIKPIALSFDPKLSVEIMGSYRRGKADCGDIDIMITRNPRDGKTHAGILARLLPKLKEEGIISEHLAVPDDPYDQEAIYRGLCRLPHVEGSKHRRLDFLTVPWKSKGAALLYYTGDDIFNRAMRMKARVHGYSLNQKGLYKGVIRDPSNRTLETNTGTIIASETEEEIFKILQVPWQEPHERVRNFD